jgi:glutaredoxin
MSRVIVCSTDPCPYVQAKALLDERGIALEEITLGRYPAGPDALLAAAGGSV